MTQTILPRKTFAIISHPDAGKTTLTEKLLLTGGAINLAGSVKGKKADRHATSDWMALERERGISVTTSVMQFCYQETIVNLLDTPGHEDFSEDTYRTLTAVDSVLMVIDVAKGVEARTIKLMQVCRLRDTPIMTFINKLDREGKSPIDLLDEIETVLDLPCAPITWPIGQGSQLRGLYHLYHDVLVLTPQYAAQVNAPSEIQGLASPTAKAALGSEYEAVLAEIDLIQGASHRFDQEAYLAGKLTPVYFGSAMTGFGVTLLLENFIRYAPGPKPRETTNGEVHPKDTGFSGFVFKIQANMDPKHRDRIAFLRVCSGSYQNRMKVNHVRLQKTVQINHALTFMASDRGQADVAYPGDIIGLHNHGTIQIGDSFCEQGDHRFVGIPHFAPELFRLVRLRDPLKLKQLQKGLVQLSEEGAVQVFRPLRNQDLIVGAVGILQFDVVKHRLQHEYQVDCVYEMVNIATARWVYSKDDKQLAEFQRKAQTNLALDGGGCLTYLAPTMVNLNVMQERWPDVVFNPTREH